MTYFLNLSVASWTDWTTGVCTFGSKKMLSYGALYMKRGNVFFPCKCGDVINYFSFAVICSQAHLTFPQCTPFQQLVNEMCS
jgi:hypothetical protein